MEFEVLKRSHLKRNIIIGVVVVAIISAVILNFTRAKYRVTQSIPIVNGTINYTLPDLNIIALYIDGVEADSLDSNTEYTLDTTLSTCTYKDGSIIDNLTLSYDSDVQTFTIMPFTTKGTKCTLYFEEYVELVRDVLLANYPTVLTRTNFSQIVTATTTGTIYKSANSSQYDNYGEVYYFAGNPTDNWVNWAGFYWRIIRINGDGSLRLIYQGTSANTTGTGTQLSGEYVFNTSNTNNAYLGYMYTSGQIHGLDSSSAIKGTLDTWYQNNLASYADDIDGNAGFCNDRTPYSGIGTDKFNTYYAAYDRLDTNRAPIFNCLDSSDLFTTKGSTNGNKVLDYPIGLITADEIAFAGGVYSTGNQNYYLYTGQDYWTLTPYHFWGNAGMYYVSSEGQLRGGYNVNVSSGARPVVNLKADVQITGSGTALDPYEVVM